MEYAWWIYWRVINHSKPCNSTAWWMLDTASPTSQTSARCTRLALLEPFVGHDNITSLPRLGHDPTEMGSLRGAVLLWMLPPTTCHRTCGSLAHLLRLGAETELKFTIHLSFCDSMSVRLMPCKQPHGILGSASKPVQIVLSSSLSP